MRWLTVPLMSLALLTGCGGGDDDTVTPVMPQPTVLDVDDSGTSSVSLTVLSQQLATLPVGTLSADEEAGLLYMREEEKLARDVYLTMYNLWGQQVFENISEAEETHAEAVKMLLDRYNLVDPVGSNGIGVFTDPQLQTLYDTLVNQGTTSLMEALYVGAAIEELDIVDITAEEAKIENNDDIALVYANLKKGSRNHLRAFYRNIIRAGGSYTPQYLTQAEFDVIVNSDVERGSI